ncbi:MAG: hypothetical protein K1X94_19080, partial [Sandaracinaceae bacterium]|nr:hypothetical protein [Sandaracinaceae bacterium]
PLGRTLAVFDDATVTTRLLVIHRVGAAEEDAPAEATVIGAAWVGGIERELSIVAQAEATDRSATLFGPVGRCGARVTRTLTLRGTAEGQAPTTYAALEVSPCEGTSVESIETTHPFGVEGEVQVTSFDSASMSAATEAQSAVVADVEREAGEGEEMELEAAELSDAHVAVLSGWQSYVVRDGEVLGTYEDGVPAAATIDGRTYLLAREGREIRLLVVDERGLSPVALDAAPTDAAGGPREDAVEGGDEGEPTP